jgi:hypothetical protein
MSPVAGVLTGQALRLVAPSLCPAVTEPPPAPAPWPTKTHALEMSEQCAYGWARNKVVEMGAPPSLAYLSLLAVHAGQSLDFSTDEDLHVSLYVCIVGPVRMGKSVTVDRSVTALFGKPVAKALRARQPCHGLKNENPSSGEALSEIYPAMIGKEEAPLMASTLVIDEMSALIKSAQGQYSKLPQTLNTLFYNDAYSSSSVKGGRPIKVRLNILGNLPAPNAEKFRELWGQDTSTGLHDRFIIAPGPTMWRWDHRLVIRTEHRPPKRVTIPDHVYALYQAWVDIDPATRGRCGEIALRVAVLSSSLNGEVTMTVECMNCALRLAAWQVLVRETYSASDAKNPDAVFGELLLGLLREARTPEGGFAWVEWRKLYRKKHFNDHGGPLVKRVRESLITEQQIECEFSEDEVGRAKAVKRVRLVAD